MDTYKKLKTNDEDVKKAPFSRSHRKFRAYFLYPWQKHAGYVPGGTLGTTSRPRGLFFLDDLRLLERAAARTQQSGPLDGGLRRKPRPPTPLPLAGRTLNLPLRRQPQENDWSSLDSRPIVGVTQPRRPMAPKSSNRLTKNIFFRFETMYNNYQ